MAEEEKEAVGEVAETEEAHAEEAPAEEAEAKPVEKKKKKKKEEAVVNAVECIVRYAGTRNEVWACGACGHNHMPEQFTICEGCGVEMIPPKIEE